jgi:hypothetical protein
MHGRLAACWILLFFSISCFQISQDQQNIHLAAAADQSAAAAGSIMKFLGNRIAAPAAGQRSRMCS